MGRLPALTVGRRYICISIYLSVCLSIYLSIYMYLYICSFPFQGALPYLDLYASKMRLWGAYLLSQWGVARALSVGETNTMQQEVSIKRETGHTHTHDRNKVTDRQATRTKTQTHKHTDSERATAQRQLSSRSRRRRPQDRRCPLGRGST